LARLAASRSQLLASNFVIAETHALFVSKLGRRIALRFLDEIDTSGTSIVRVTEPDENTARTILRRYDDKDFSYVDATSFAVMARLDIREAFTFDRNFRQYGLTVLPEET